MVSRTDSQRARGSDVHIAVLGPLRIVAGDDQLDAGPPLRRKVLAVLLCSAGRAIPTSRLIDCVWSDRAGPSALGALHVHISRLRKTLGRETIVRHSYGYSLTIGPDHVDATIFSQLAHDGRSLVARGEVRQGRRLLTAALSLWRGRPYEGFDDCGWARPEIVRLEAEHLSALVARIDVDLEVGDTDVIGELEALVFTHPRHEGLCARLMLALYRSGRQADALTVYRLHTRRLAESAGLQPAPELGELQLRILRDDPALADLCLPRRVDVESRPT